MRKKIGIGTVVFIATTAAFAAGGCDHVHWLGVLDGGGSSNGDGGAYPDGAVNSDGAGDGVANSDGLSFDGSVPPYDAATYDAAAGDGGSAAAGCQAACGAIMGCGLGGYGSYHTGIGYSYAYNIGPYGLATGYSSTTNYGYGAYGFRDLEYQQCVSSCESYSSCVGCGPASERDAIVSCVLANSCPTLLDCMAPNSAIR